MSLDDETWRQLMIKTSVSSTQGGPIKTGNADLDAFEAKMHAKYGKTDG